uniref:Uncharacterized protein n=1 Tax=Tanacetum cinerariifolium TaxID=118510 RepID=A0A6L2KIM5_TANCI|nr:hypothetical protein [Tanacetum cinerariifolium]
MTQPSVFWQPLAMITSLGSGRLKVAGVIEPFSTQNLTLLCSGYGWMAREGRPQDMDGWHVKAVLRIWMDGTRGVHMDSVSISDFGMKWEDVVRSSVNTERKMVMGAWVRSEAHELSMPVLCIYNVVQIHYSLSSSSKGVISGWKPRKSLEDGFSLRTHHHLPTMCLISLRTSSKKTLRRSLRKSLRRILKKILKKILKRDLKRNSEAEDDVPPPATSPVGSPIIPPPLSESSSDTKDVAHIVANEALDMPPIGSTYEVGGPSSVSPFPPFYLHGREITRLDDNTELLLSNVKYLERFEKKRKTEMEASSFKIRKVKKCMDEIGQDLGDEMQFSNLVEHRVTKLEDKDQEKAEEMKKIKKRLRTLETNYSLVLSDRDEWKKAFYNLQAWVSERLGRGALDARPDIGDDGPASFRESKPPKLLGSPSSSQ